MANNLPFNIYHSQPYSYGDSAGLEPDFPFNPFYSSDRLVWRIEVKNQISSKCSGARNRIKNDFVNRFATKARKQLFELSEQMYFFVSLWTPWTARIAKDKRTLRSLRKPCEPCDTFFMLNSAKLHSDSAAFRFHYNIFNFSRVPSEHIVGRAIN